METLTGIPALPVWQADSRPDSDQEGTTDLESGDDAVRITVARSFEEVEALRCSWQLLQGDAVSTDPDWFLGLLRILPGEGRPHVVVLERDGTPEAMLVANVRRRRVPCRIGRKALYSPTVSTLAVVEDGLLGSVDAATAQALFDELMRALDRKEADVCIFRHLPVTSPLRTTVRARVPVLRRSHGSRADARLSRPLPESYDAFLRTLSRGMRKGLRRSTSRIEGELGARLSVRAFRRRNELDAFLEDAESVARKTYQRARGVGFRNDDLTRRMTTEAADRGWFRGWLLYVDGEAIALEHGVAYHGRFRWSAGGFDPAFSHLRPGMYLMTKVLEELCGDPDITALDFGLGDAEYKRRLGCSSRLEDDVYVSARRLRPVWITSVHSALTVIAQVFTSI